MINSPIKPMITSVIRSLITPELLNKYSILTDTNGRWLADTNGLILLIRR